MTQERRFRKILVPMDFSPGANRALELASDLARQAGPAHLILVHAYFVPVEIEALAVIGPEKLLEDIRARAADDLEKILVRLQDAGISAEYDAAPGSPEEVVLRLADDKEVDLIVMGTHGRTGLTHVLLGSVAERVVRAASCPVLTVKPPS
jgi:nucleotide-binding universal stress UspA family protein